MSTREEFARRRAELQRARELDAAAAARSRAWHAYLTRTESCDCDLGGMGRRTDCKLHGEAS